MKFDVGTEVRFRHTGDSARITKDNLDGSYMVWSYDLREEIVAFNDDILLARDFKISDLEKIHTKQAATKKLSTEEVFYGVKALNKQEPPKNYNPNQKTTSPTHLPNTTTTTNSTPQKTAANTPTNSGFVPAAIKAKSPTNTGLYLAFWQDAPQSYVIYLVNDTPNSVTFFYERYLNNYCEQELRHTIAPHDFFAVDQFKHQYFNDTPIIDFESAGINFQSTLRLKYKSFLNKYCDNTPLMSAPTYLYQLFAGDYNPLKAAEKGGAMALAEYTKQQIAHNTELQPKVQKLTPTELRAQFPRVFDLHIEALIDDPKRIVGSALGFQINKMEAYLLKASQLGIEEVTLIHGIGDGKLKDAIHTRLRTHPLVDKMTNEHHPLYGFGSTIVKLKG